MFAGFAVEQESGLEADACTGLLARCLSVDFEVEPASGRIRSFAAVRGLSRQSFVHSRGNLADALFRLDEFAKDADFLIGHNIITFDRPHLEAAQNSLNLLHKPLIDTLWLNPLAFPKNPYHHLIKHYQDGRLQGGHLNDPEQDARLVLDVLQDQAKALAQIDRRNPGLAAAFHWLTTTGKDEPGFDAFFWTVRQQERPDIGRARTCVGRLLDGVACTRQVDLLLNSLERHGWPLAYALSWISVVWRGFRHAALGAASVSRGKRARRRAARHVLRRSRLLLVPDPQRSGRPLVELVRLFRLPARTEGRGRHAAAAEDRRNGDARPSMSSAFFRPAPASRSATRLPALARFDKIGALTVVISPLVALMADQVEGLRRQGISSCVAVNGFCRCRSATTRSTGCGSGMPRSC